MSMFRDLGRRRLLGLAIASTMILPRAEAAAPDFNEDYAIGEGARLFYVRAGGGPLMLFLHGAPDDWSLYEDQLREFGRDHLVVAPNLRGFPPSDQPEAVEAYTMPKLLGDISALLRHFGRERRVLVGHDWGGYFAWVFASAYSAWFNYYRADPIKIPPSIFEAANLEMPDLAARFFYRCASAATARKAATTSRR